MSWRHSDEFNQRRSGAARRRRLLGASVAVLTLAGAGAALADVTVDGGSTAVATATASSAGPDNITQTGTLNVASGPAITLNSSNSVTNSGTIQTQNASNLTGILALGGNTGEISNTGQITFNQTDVLTTTSSTGIVSGPFATDTNLYGIRVQGPGTLTGGILNSGGITIQGTSSAAISVEAPITGVLTSSGTITVSGDNSTGIRTTAAVGGAVQVTGALTASGQNAQAVNIGGDVGGQLAISSAVVATGYHQTSRSTDTNTLADENKLDILQGGVAVTVGGNLGQGLLVMAPPAVLSTTVTDLNGDGWTDSTETTGSVNAYGGAPAIVVGATGRDVTLGTVGTGVSAFGVVIEGTVAGSGLRDGIAANGLQLGVDGGGKVSIPTGISVTGVLSAAAYGGDATSLHVLSGASSSVLYNGGRIEASMTGETTNAAQAVVVESGGSLPTILNAGNLEAIVVGSSGSATAILDKAGSLTHLENTGSITAAVDQATGSTIPVTGTAVAIDDSANTTGFSLLSYKGADFTTLPSITGAVRMGSGNDSVDIEAGTLTGDLSFGAGANALTVNGGSSVVGAVTADGGTLALSVGAASLTINNAAQLNLTSLNLGSGSNLTLTVDPAAGAATSFTVAGTANIAADAKIGLRTTSLVNGAQTYTLVNATTLNLAGPASSLLSTTPYIYAASLSSDAAAGTLTLSLARKTAAQLDLPSSIADAYEPLTQAIGADTVLSQALVGPTDRASFIASYNQLLPEHSGAIFQLVRASAEGFGRPLDDRQAPEGGGAWVEEVNIGAFHKDRDDLPGYKSWGIGLIAGFEAPATPVGIFGATLGGFSGEVRPHDAPSNADAIANVIEAGGYWRATFGKVAVNARVAADHLSATDHRAVTIISDGSTVFSGLADGHWSGWGVVSRARVSYEQSWNSLYLRPQAGVDYMRLSEDAYTETGGGAIDLSVDSRTSSEFSAFAGLAIGAVFNQQGGSWGPELTLGYRDVVNHGDGLTTARFVSGGPSFTVGPEDISGGGGVARLSLKSESAWGAVSLEGGAEMRDGLDIYDAKLAVHLLF
jgi:hypothetical protein